jgi:uncharacterized protein (DUF2062 family)
MTHPSPWQRRVVIPLLTLLRQGVTPGQMALSLAVGTTLGIIPVLGTTTLLCTVASVAFRLNLVAIQIINWLVYPLQIALLVPFFRAGEWLFGRPPLGLTPSQVVAMFKADFWGSIRDLWDTTWHAVVVWLILGIPLTVALHFILRVALRSLAQRRVQSSAPASPST